MTIRKTKIQASDRHPVQLIGRHVIAKHVTAIIGKPQLTGLRMPAHSDRITHAPRDDFPSAAVGIHAQDQAKLFFVTDVAGCTDRHIELPIRPKSQVPPGMQRIFVGQVISKDFGYARLSAALFGLREAQYAPRLRNV